MTPANSQVYHRLDFVATKNYECEFLDQVIFVFTKSLALGIVELDKRERLDMRRVLLCAQPQQATCHHAVSTHSNSSGNLSQFFSKMKGNTEPL